MALAIENHQDADSEDLLWLCESVGGEFIGVNLDTGNPLAVGEGPVEFAARIAPFLKNVHLKDYRMHRTPAGYRLVRCPLGDGVVDFPALQQAEKSTLATACDDDAVPRARCGSAAPAEAADGLTIRRAASQDRIQAPRKNVTSRGTID